MAKSDKKEHVIIRGYVNEMTTNIVDLQLPAEINVTELTEGDSNPMFVTARVLEETTSRNGNIYSRSILDEVCDQINKNKPYAYRGHIEESKKSTKAPHPETQWLYAEIRDNGGKAELFAKGYVFQGAKRLREQLRVASKVKKLVPVSISGDAYSKYNKQKGGNELTGITIESIDWARDGAQGVKTAGAITVTREMEDKNIMNDKEFRQKISEMKADELRELNPELVEEVSDKSTITEMAGILGVEADAVKAKVEEMKSALEKADTDKKALQEQLDGYAIDRELRARVKNSAARKVVRKMVLTEMKLGSESQDAITKVLESEEGKAIISEMGINIPDTGKKQGDDEGKTKHITYR